MTSPKVKGHLLFEIPLMNAVPPLLFSPQRRQRLYLNARDRLFNAERISLAGQSPYSCIHADGLVSVRHHPPLQESHIRCQGQTLPVKKQRHQIPVVLVSPLAVNMLIYDLFPERSLIRYLQACGFDVYLIDWGRPGREHTHFDLATYVLKLMPECLTAIRTHSGSQELSLHGWSMGGHFVLCYAGLGIDTALRNLVILGSHIDSHASGSLGTLYQRLNQGSDWLKKRTGLHPRQIPTPLFHTPGWINVINFKLTNPIGSLQGYWELMKHLDDRDFVIDHATNAAFLDHMVDYPGGIVRDMLLRVWMGNELKEGRLDIAGHRVDFKNIQSRLLIIAGKDDTLATSKAVRQLTEVTAAREQRFVEVPGGHMGIVSGSRAPATAWKETIDWLAANSD